MKKLIIIVFFAIELFSQSITTLQTPAIYSTLGDKIFNNAKNIEKLKFTLEYESDKDRITKYIKDVEKIKKQGFKIQDGDIAADKKAYLEKLRELSLTNDYYVDKITDNLNSSIKSKDNALFLKSVNSGLLIIENNKKTILNYYYENNESIEATGILKNIIDKYKKKPLPKGLTKAQLEKIEIERIRKKDKIKQEAIEKSLEEEVKRKKIEIRKIQKKELETKTN